jgi:hypothetical protein
MSATRPTIAERYELGDVLGRGGMSEVRAGRDLRLGRDVAIKLLTTVGADGSRMRERFEAEARAVASLSHPNVVLVFDSGEHDGVPYLVMERLPGRTLADEMAAGPLSPERAVRVTTDVLAALGAAHAAGIVHRDIKPSNVLVCADGAVKVSDFGIAKTAAAMTLTDDGTLLGTPGYLAPERLTGEPATPQSDLYSVGVLLYEALSGRPPFEGDSPAQLLRAIAEGRPVPLQERRPDLPPRLAQAVERAMEREPSARFATAAEMSAALGDEHAGTEATGVLVAPGGQPEETEAVAAMERAPGRVPDRRSQVVGGLCVVVVLALVLGIVTRSGDDPEAATPAAPVATGPPQPLPQAAGPLAPGRYRTATLQPPIDLSVDSGWALGEPEAADVLFLKRTGGERPAAELTVLSVDRVFPGDRTYQSAADYVAAGAGEPAPPNLLAWLQRHPRLKVSTPSETRVGGVDAIRVDIEAGSPYRSEVCVGQCVALFQLRAEPGKYRLVKLDQGETMRLYIVQVAGRTVVVSVVVPTEALGSVTHSVDAVVKTIAFAP